MDCVQMSHPIPTNSNFCMYNMTDLSTDSPFPLLIQILLVFAADIMQAYPGQHAPSFVQNTGFYPSSFYTNAAQSSMASYPGVRGKDATSYLGYPAPPYSYAGNYYSVQRCYYLLFFPSKLNKSLLLIGIRDSTRFM